MKLPVVIAAGGTGGHLVPALAIADALRRAEPAVSISFVGTRRPLDRELVGRAGYRAHATSVRPFARGARGLLAPLSLVPATAQARRILRAEGARAVVGMGGYASVPVVLAARLARIPALIHEGNAVPGLANELAARLTPHVAVSFPETQRAFGKRSPRLVGVPLRAAIAELDRGARRGEAHAAFGLDPDRRTVLVFGGSQGAARLNLAAGGLADRWRDRADVQVLWAAGAEAVAVRARVSGGALVVRVEPFIEHMELAYAAADVAVCRAGASTVAELAAASLPAVLVPYPHARRREQDANARALASLGAAEVIEDAALDARRLAALLEGLLGDAARLEAMTKAARTAARAGAADEMAAWVLDLAEGERG